MRKSTPGATPIGEPNRADHRGLREAAADGPLVVITREGVKFNDDGESNFRSFVDGYNAGVAYYLGQAGGGP